jgi:hypothetical protein
VFPLLQHTHDTFKLSTQDFTPHLVIFAAVDSIANLLDLNTVLRSDSMLFYRSNKIWKIITPMTDTRVTSVIQTHQRRLHEKSYVPCTTFGRATLGVSGVANNLFIAFLFSDPDFGVHFLKDVRLIPSSTVLGRCLQQLRSVTSHTTQRPIPCVAESNRNQRMAIVQPY